jgi:penicillin-binding protein 1A
MRRMQEAGAITEAEYLKLSATKIKLNFHNPDYREGSATYMREHIRQELQAWCDKNPRPDGRKWNLYEDGLKVFTTIDSRMQKYAEESTKEHLTFLQEAFFKEWKEKTLGNLALALSPNCSKK